jgi:hypothetical protein
MKTTIALILAFAFCSTLHAQTELEKLESEYVKSLDMLNQDYFNKLRNLQLEHITLLEAKRKDAMTKDELTEAIRIRDHIEKLRAAIPGESLPEEKGKLTKEKVKLAANLSSSKWECSAVTNISKYAGSHIVFHENGTIVPASKPETSNSSIRWAIVDGRTIIGMFGDYQMIFIVRDDGKSMDVLEVGNVIDTKAKRHGYVVASPSITRSPRDRK